MKIYSIAITLLTMLPAICIAQSSDKAVITNPFDSIAVSPTAHLGKQGLLHVKIDITNKNSKSARLNLQLGGFDRFGLKDQNGGKYKVFTNEQFSGPDNEGYKRIRELAFGDKTMQKLTFLVQDFEPGETKTFRFSVPNWSKQSKEVSELHISAIYTRDYEHQGSNQIKFENLPVGSSGHL